MVFGVSPDCGEKVSLCTCVAGALEDRCGPSVMRAAARGSEELMSTGALISIEVPVVSQHLRRALRHAERSERVPLLGVLLPLRVSVRAVPVTADGFCARR